VNELQKAAPREGSGDPGLKAKLDAIEVAQKLAITEAVSVVEKERDELKSGLERRSSRSNWPRSRSRTSTRRRSRIATTRSSACGT
jgi:hypothetical protein